jgi:hypothetical protein
MSADFNPDRPCLGLKSAAAQPRGADEQFQRVESKAGLKPSPRDRPQSAVDDVPRSSLTCGGSVTSGIAGKASHARRPASRRALVHASRALGFRRPDKLLGRVQKLVASMMPY